MNVINLLEIFLVTYNRKISLEKTLNAILDEQSPIKNCSITILDNASTDGTEELLYIYTKKYKNIKIIRHKKNIGGNANICRAIELASYKYFWILCDDDDYDWSFWHEVEYGLTNNFDAILTERKVFIDDNKNFPFILNSCAFVPACIYKTQMIDSDVLQNAYVNIMFSFPHLAVACHFVNINANFYVPQHTIVHQNVNHSFSRGYKKEIHPRIIHTDLFSGYINSYQLITNPDLKKKCIDTLYIGKSFFYSMKYMISHNSYKYNMCDVFNGINYRQKIQFILAYISVKVINIYSRHGKVYIKLFDKLKIKIFDSNLIFFLKKHQN